MEKIEISTEYIKLDQLLKFINITTTGGEGKELITSGKVKVNNEVELRRGRKVKDGDKVDIEKKSFVIISKI